LTDSPAGTYHRGVLIFTLTGLILVLAAAWIWHRIKHHGLLTKGHAGDCERHGWDESRAARERHIAKHSGRRRLKRWRR
jgi:hypothetical protein